MIRGFKITPEERREHKRWLREQKRLAKTAPKQNRSTDFVIPKQPCVLR